MATSDRLTNQTVLDAVFAAARDLEGERFALVERAGFWPLFLTRAEPYPGPPIAELEALSQEEKQAIQRRLIELLVRRQSSTAVTRTHLNLRTGPGTDFETLTTLAPGTEMALLGEQGTWLEAQVAERRGFVHRDYVDMAGGGVSASGFLSARSDLQNVPLALPAGNGGVGALQAGANHPLAGLWARYGRGLAVLANELDIEADIAVAVLATESGGQGFGPDGRLLIRFENHVFFGRWGEANRELFDRHFAFDRAKPWQGHLWRPAEDQPWQSFHGNQEKEWQVYAFAAGLDRRAARESISMGLPQIMGFNYASLGYGSVDEMFDAFAGGERAHLLGFFDFVRSKDALDPLRRGDFFRFAEIYNGSGQAAHYNNLIQERLATFRRLRGRPDERALPPAPGPDAGAPAGEVARQLLHLLAALRHSLAWQQFLLGTAVVAGLAAVVLALISRQLAVALVPGAVSTLALAVHLLRPPERTAQQVESVARLLGQLEGPGRG